MTKVQTPDLFLFAKGVWIGEGTIIFTATAEELAFYTKWQHGKSASKSKVRCSQQVEMGGVEDKVLNHFCFYDICDKKFKIELENELVGHVQGLGVYSEKEVAWEFRKHLTFEGFEVYRLREDGDWSLHAEFASDQFRTIIKGRLWKK